MGIRGNLQAFISLTFLIDTCEKQQLLCMRSVVQPCNHWILYPLVWEHEGWPTERNLVLGSSAKFLIQKAQWNSAENPWLLKAGAVSFVMELEEVWVREALKIFTLPTGMGWDSLPPVKASDSADKFKYFKIKHKENSNMTSNRSNNEARMNRSKQRRWLLLFSLMKWWKKLWKSA